MSNMSVTIFNYKNNEIRTVTKNGEPWFVVKDICESFGDTNYRRSVARLDNDEKGVSQIETPGGHQNMLMVNEAGLYSLLFMMQPQKANLPKHQYEHRNNQLKQFKRWVTHEVLPSIRKTGKYNVSDSQVLSDKDKSKMLKIVEKYGKTMEQDCLEAMLSQITGIQIKLIPEFRTILLPKSQKSNIIPFSRTSHNPTDKLLAKAFWEMAADILAQGKLDHRHFKICNGTLRVWMAGIIKCLEMYHPRGIKKDQILDQLKKQPYFQKCNTTAWMGNGNNKTARVWMFNVALADESLKKVIDLLS